MVSTMKFGRKLSLPSIIQIKHQLLVRWLADQQAKEAAEIDPRNPRPDVAGPAPRQTP